MHKSIVERPKRQKKIFGFKKFKTITNVQNQMKPIVVKLSEHDAAIRIQKWWRNLRKIVIRTEREILFDRFH